MEASSCIEKLEKNEYDDPSSLSQEERHGKRDHQDGL
jgi:hypothetical protein